MNCQSNSARARRRALRSLCVLGRRGTALLLVLLFPVVLAAQQSADVIRGRVTGADSLPIPNAQVTAVSYFGGITKSTRTDRNGRYSITYPNGEGDYWLSFAAIGYQGQRIEVKRIADEEVLVADIRLTNAQVLAQVTTTANAARQTPPRTENTVDNSGADRFISNGFVNPDLAGNLAAMASTTPGVQLIPGVDGNPDRFSVLGLDPSQNNATLNGQQNGLSNIPRDAGVSSQMRGGYDVAYGGFSGAQIAVNTNSGTNYTQRSMSGVFNAPQAQWNDRVGQASQYSAMSLGGRAAGPFVLDKDFFAVSWQFDRRRQDLATLLSSSPVVFQSAGIATDSVARLRTILDAIGVPLTGRGIGATSDRTTFNTLGAFDWAPRTASAQAFTVAYNASYNVNGPASTSPMQTPGSLASSKSASGGLQVRHTNYFGALLTESQVGVSGSRFSSDPFIDLPSGTVLVSSSLADGTATTRSLAFGGGVNASTNTDLSLTGRNVLSWFSSNNKHRLKLVTELRLDRTHAERATNLRGRFTYQSLADLEAGTPSSFSRALNAIDQSGAALVGAIAIGDAWRPSTNVQVQYGVRVDANRFLTRPDENPAVAATFGTANTHVPNRAYVSPRLGFSWLYGQAAQIPFAEGFAFGPRATIRGGIGLFQNMRGPDLAAGAIAATGLPGSAQQLTCTGTATPHVDWSAMRADASLVPTACADGTGGTVFANASPSVTLFGAGYAQEQSLRSNLNWYGAILDNRYTATINAQYSYNFHQPDALDLNFRADQQFVLAEEGGRPVYVQRSSIDPRSGLIASRAARASTAFNGVSQLRSDLASQSRQVSISIAPLNYSQPRFRWNATYAFLDVVQEYRGFSSTAASPLSIHSGIAAQPRHDIGYTLTYNLRNAITLSWGGRLTSGTRFTPTVGSDVNGDGRANDRAFVFDPNGGGDAALRAAMGTLLEHGSGAARACLRSQLGTIADRNSCTGPWTMGNTNLRVTFNPSKIRLPQRTTVSLTLTNPVAAADLLFHGQDKLHGWGQAPVLDQTLLFVRGFDAATSRYVYEVNQRFGSARTTQTTSRAPVVLTLQMGYDFAPTRDWQNLKLNLDRGRTRTGTKMSEAALRTYSMGLFPNPMARMLQTGEQLHLTRLQADSLATMSRRYTRLVDSLWTPAAKHLASLPKDYDRTDAQRRLVAAREVAVSYLITVAPHVKGLLTKGQLRVLSSSIASMLEPRYLELLRSGQVGGESAFYFF